MKIYLPKSDLLEHAIKMNLYILDRSFDLEVRGAPCWVCRFEDRIYSLR